MTQGTAYPNFGEMAPDKVLPSLYERIHQLEQALTAIGYDTKASKRERFPTKIAEAIRYGITRALCIETIDPWKENRVRFYHPILHDPNAKLGSLPFASPVSTMGGFDDCGLSWVPPAGSTIMIFFEGGSVRSAYYLGTTWHRDRGPGGSQIASVFQSREWTSIYADHRAGNFLHGPDDGSQVLPPWNTESYNAGDIDQIQQFTTDPLEQLRVTYPNIYGFKTPEKHMLKLVDGNAKCNRRWKRIELMSGCGNWLIFKDDHLHYGGQWAHPSCGATGPPVETCSESKADLPYFSDIHGQPLEKSSDCDPDCSGGGTTQCSQILGGHSSTPCDPFTKFCQSNQGSNKFFKQKNECRPYLGPGTPQNNSCDLPQTGIQFLTIGGHTMVMDDSVEEPRGIPEWERSLKEFDFGCSDKCLGRLYVKSMTGHGFMMSDIETDTGLRGANNFISLKSASGNSLTLNDETVGEPCLNDPCSPPNYAGPNRGIVLRSTSNHTITMNDNMNLQCSPRRKEGGIPKNAATQAYIRIRSGFGLEMRFNDDNSQTKTQNQWIQILHPQCAEPTDQDCNGCAENECRGPHFLRFQGRSKGTPGIVFLRAGGHSIRQTYDDDMVLVGDKEKNPADKFTYVSRKHIRATEDIDFRYSGKLHILFAEEQILLMAGRDCPPPPGKTDYGPCLYNVIIARCPVFCPLTGILHWTEKAMSERVFASGYGGCPPEKGKPGPNIKPTPPPANIKTSSVQTFREVNKIDPNTSATTNVVQ